uniref:BRCA2 TR2 domain-containing protein n=1 Tax=Sphenodon punctatus TaxID=8508 RepID=A0A8D0L9J5_SPHPU
MNLLQTKDPQVFNLPKECGLPPFSPVWKSGFGSGNKCLNATPTSEIKYRSPLSTSKLDLKSSVPPGSTKITPHAIYAEETPKNCKKRKAMTLLGQIPSPPPVIPVSTFVPPSLKKAFQPPRSLGNQCDKSLKRTNCNSVQMTPLKRINEEFHENDLVADEELAMINTQMLLHNLPEEKKIDSVDETSSVISSNPPDPLLLENNSFQSVTRAKRSQDSSTEAGASEENVAETDSYLAAQKNLQRQKKTKRY